MKILSNHFKAITCLLLIVMCMMSFSQSSFAVCHASFTYVKSGSVVQFTNLSQSSNPPYYSWSFGDGTYSTLENPVHQYNSSGPFQVCLILNDSINCYNTFCDSIYFGCHASYTFNQAGFIFNFTNTSSGNFPDASWDFGDGTTSTQLNPSHEFPAVGNYQVCLTISDSSIGCNNTYCENIFVMIDSNQQCNACFTWVVTFSGVHFSDCSASGSQVTSWQWDLGDGNTSTQQNPVYNYNALGPYFVCLTITDSSGCSSTICDSVFAYNYNCQAAFTYAQNDSAFQFINQSTGSFNSIHWTFGDGGTSYYANPSYIYSGAGTYTVCLTVADSTVCQSTTCQTVTVGGNSCTANFVLHADSSQVGLYLGYNLSYGNNLTYSWTWGDNTSSTGQYPTHLYTVSGYYTICLTILDTVSQCTDDFCSDYYILKSSGMSSIHEVIFVNTTGVPAVNGTREIQWKIFPNPASNAVTIQTNADQIDEIRITDVSGKVMQQLFLYSGEIISLESLPQGVYIVRTLIEGMSSSKLLIRQ